MLLKAIIFGLLAFFSNFVFSADWEDPEHLFNVQKLNYNKITLEWIRVDDVQAACEKQSQNRGLGGFKIAVQACSFWTGNNCVLITSKKASLHSLGHEVRHCFQGAYH